MKVRRDLIGYIICVVLIILTLGAFLFSSNDFIRSLGIYLFLGVFLITFLIKDDMKTAVQKKMSLLIIIHRKKKECHQYLRERDGRIWILPNG
jgi:hypothetical protein